MAEGLDITNQIIDRRNDRSSRIVQVNERPRPEVTSVPAAKSEVIQEQGANEDEELDPENNAPIPETQAQQPSASSVAAGVSTDRDPYDFSDDDSDY